VECTALAKRVAELAVGGGDTGVRIETMWTGNLRYARNEVSTSGDVRDNLVTVRRDINGANGAVDCNQIDDVGLQAAVRRAERLVSIGTEKGGVPFEEHFLVTEDAQRNTTGPSRLSDADRQEALQSLMQTPEEYAKPKIFFDTTYNLDATRRSEVVLPLIASAKTAGVLAAGYVEVSANGRALIDSWGRALYYPWTQAQYSVTVRDPNSRGSGWAGVDWSDWARIDPQHLSNIALDKCLRSRNPVMIEPGRYTVVLEPQAVGDICSKIMEGLDRSIAESGQGPFHGTRVGETKIGERVVDERISISADPMDPDLGFPPFDRYGNAYHPVFWIEHGVLKNLSYNREYGIQRLGINSSLLSSGAFRMSGGTTTIDEMIATTKRGLWVTRFSNIDIIDGDSLLCSGYTRDGLWLIENGKVSKAVKNFRFTESPMFVLNNIDALGVPQRIFRPGAPAVVPPIKARDFSFTSLSEAI
jgi:predicted Zn-dependent protease